MWNAASKLRSAQSESRRWVAQSSRGQKDSGVWTCRTRGQNITPEVWTFLTGTERNLHFSFLFFLSCILLSFLSVWFRTRPCVLAVRSGPVDRTCCDGLVLEVSSGQTGGAARCARGGGLNAKVKKKNFSYLFLFLFFFLSQINLRGDCTFKKIIQELKLFWPRNRKLSFLCLFCCCCSTFHHHFDVSAQAFWAPCLWNHRQTHSSFTSLRSYRKVEKKLVNN